MSFPHSAMVTSVSNIVFELTWGSPPALALDTLYDAFDWGSRIPQILLSLFSPLLLSFLFFSFLFFSSLSFSSLQFPHRKRLFRAASGLSGF